MTVRELYGLLEARYPSALSAEWDHDGLQCSPDPSAPVRRVLAALDVTEATVERAVAVRADVILSHHPLLFQPLHEVVSDAGIGRRIARLFSAGISVMSFHTRADAAEGGVNDLLAGALSLTEVSPFADGLGRVGVLSDPEPLEVFARRAVAALGAPMVTVGDAGRPVCRVAVLGGSGKSEIEAAIASGADTFLSGRLSYETVNEAAELGINLIEAGHFYTEALLPKLWAKELPSLGMDAEYFDSCHVRTVGHN